MYTLILLSWGLDSKTTREKQKSANNWPLRKKTKLSYFLMFFFFCWNAVTAGSCFFSPIPAFNTFNIMRHGSEDFPLKGPCNVLLFLGRNRKCAWPRGMKPRQEWDKLINLYVNIAINTGIHVDICVRLHVLVFTNFWQHFFLSRLYLQAVVLISLDTFRCLLHHPQEHSLTKILPRFVCPL